MAERMNPTTPDLHDRRFFGHPRGLATLFMTELWERFSYYGTRALLILLMTAAPSAGGLGFDVPKAGAIYGLYTSMVYMMSLPGGWLADRFLGLRRAVWWGGLLIALGNACLAVDDPRFFYGGLVVVVLGTGLLKPNVSTIVGQLYQPGDARRDSGFSLFYMGINLGAFLSPLACGWLGQRVNWHLGFALASAGMTLGVIQYLAGGRHLPRTALRPAAPATAAEKRQLRFGLLAVAAALVLFGTLDLTAQQLSDGLGVFLLLLSVAFFAWLFSLGHWTPVERKRLVVVGVLFLASSLFWCMFEQAGSTLNLFAQRSTRNSVFGFVFPASWLQSMNALFIILLAPVFAWIWIKLGRREPSSPAKFVCGLMAGGLGFAVIALGALAADSGGRVSVLWLMAVYLLHTVGELCLSPVGLSAMTKLAPARIGGLLMGVWFLSTSVGNYMGGRFASLYEALPLPQLFGLVAAFGIVAGFLLALFTRPTERLMGGVK
ncbi:MAG: peptide MFS transporter [Acidobacteria bacterium]|nr:peptide MFS transporter [Acidobacteriota bacterium]